VRRILLFVEPKRELSFSKKSQWIDRCGVQNASREKRVAILLLGDLLVPGKGAEAGRPITTVKLRASNSLLSWRVSTASPDIGYSRPRCQRS
jgi:hypothetical protein